MRRALPTDAEAAEILARKRTRPQRRSAPTAGRQLAPLIKQLDERFGRGHAGLAARWREIVGETLARRTEPVKVTKPRDGSGGALEIRVDGPAAALIQHQAPEILSRANLFLGDGAVTKLRIVQGPVKAPASAAARPSRRKLPPLDAAREAELAQSVEPAERGLAAALQRLGREVLRRDR